MALLFILFSFPYSSTLHHIIKIIDFDREVKQFIYFFATTSKAFCFQLLGNTNTGYNHTVTMGWVPLFNRKNCPT